VLEDEDDLGVHPDLRYDGPRPLYRQVADHIEERIRSGELEVDVRLPAERDLMDHYRVSYSTIRRAMEELRKRHTINTVHGKGNYVARVPAERGE
jgi:DNA-binding GntR family transcriptional regulator